MQGGGDDLVMHYQHSVGFSREKSTFSNNAAALLRLRPSYVSSFKTFQDCFLWFRSLISHRNSCDLHALDGLAAVSLLSSSPALSAHA
ncbi:hypothetical protein NPIL_511311 [Nephila pilipes]|uniref:Uncharacterized protein n=1 Tax=Nephila pilipes TaxID=299642 RepID=A0A8X6PL24_NEPPI|nr:hypothetical protein NPIL_511311 [Nephila pilipes]